MAVPFSQLVAQKGHAISLKINGMKDSTCYLANYYGEKTYIQDTAKMDSEGKLVFQGTEPLPGGIYIVAQGKNRLFEFIVNKEQKFSLETTAPDYNKNMKIKGSPENKLFFDYLAFNAQKFLEVEPYQKALKRVEKKPDSLALVKETLNKVNKEVENYKVDFIAAHPETFIAAFFKAMKEPEIPQAPVLKNGRKDSVFVYNYYKEHYWDNLDLTDDRLLRTPVFHNKLDQYLNKVIYQIPDSINKEVDLLINRARANKEVFKYLVWYITNYYETSQVMGFDAVFVHMSEKYYESNEAYWVNPTVLQNITRRANTLKKLMIGQPAPNLVMLDTSMVPVSLYNVKAKYTLVFFWDSDCGHCKAEVPKVKKFYEDFREKYDLEIYGVAADTSMAKMKAYIRTNGLKWINVNGPRALTPNFHDLYDISSTPVMYLLDEKKTIVAKKLLTEQLEKFLEKYDKIRHKTESSH